MPTALSIPMNSAKYAWQFETEAEPHLDKRRMHCPRGKVLGLCPFAVNNGNTPLTASVADVILAADWQQKQRLQQPKR